MRFLFLNRYFYPDISATSQLLTELTEDLAANGDTVTVITGNMSYLSGKTRLPAEDTYKGIRILRVGFTSFGRSRTLGRLVDYLSFWLCAFWVTIRTKHQDCLIVLSDPPLLSVIAAVVKLAKPIRTVCWLQDVFPEIAIRAGVLREGVTARLLRVMAKWSLRRMDQVVVIGRCMERYLHSQGLPARAIVNIPNWADGSHLQPLSKHDNVFIKEHGLQDKFVVMYSGNHGVVHEHETLTALLRETRSIPRLCYCFVGEGGWKKELIETARAEGWQHVLSLPYQPKTYLHSSLSAADVHLVSLRNEMEGLSVPSKLYGILAAGRPVLFIGPAGSEAGLVVREAECGFCVRPGDIPEAVKALLAYHHDSALVERHGAAARRYFDARFDRFIATERFHQVLDQVVLQSSTHTIGMRTVSPPTRSQ